MRQTSPGGVTPLRAARQNAGLSLEQLAVAAGLARTTVALAERAPSLMTQRTAEKVATALGISIETIWTRATP